MLPTDARPPIVRNIVEWMDNDSFTKLQKIDKDAKAFHKERGLYPKTLFDDIDRVITTGTLKPHTIAQNGQKVMLLAEYSPPMLLALAT